MELKRLQHFVALAEEGRFGLGAKRVHLSQAAFSRSIQALEDQLGLRLFDRGAGGARLTAAGASVLDRARALLAESRVLQHEVGLIRSGDVGQVTIGVAPLPASVLLPDLLSRLLSQHPGLVVRIRMGSLPTLLEQLDAQEIDFCMGDPRLVKASARYASQALGVHVGGLYCRSGHPLARRGELSVEALRQYGVAKISMSDNVQDGVARQLGLIGRDFPQRVECDDINTLLHLVEQSDVIGILPHAVVGPANKKLKLLRYPGGKDLEAHFHAIWLKGRTLAPSARRALQLAREVSKERIAAVART
jgi:DNA-binding transcriptional LysR family regulator